MLTKTINNFLSAKSANVGIIFAFAAIPAIAFIGSAIDYGQALRVKTKLQAVVDVAAAAGARLPATANQNRAAAALASFVSNATGTNLSVGTPSIAASNANVRVSATTAVATAFLAVIGVDEITVRAAASARSQIENGGIACLLALNTSSPDGLHLQGINQVSSPNCWAWINSSSTTAINASGAATGTAQGFCTAGGVSGAEHFSPPPYKGCDAMADPFYDKFVNYSVATTCSHTDLQLSSGSHTLQPGVYCGDTEFKPQAHVTLMPGLYTFKDGQLLVQAGSSVSGDGVTLFFYGADTRLEIRGGADVSIKAPAIGDLAGFVIVDRKLDWYDPTIRESIIQGGGNLKIEGIVYAPQWKISVSGNSDINQDAKFFTMIADTFYMEGNAKIHITSDAASAGLPNLMPVIKNGPVLLE